MTDYTVKIESVDKTNPTLYVVIYSQIRKGETITWKGYIEPEDFKIQEAMAKLVSKLTKEEYDELTDAIESYSSHRYNEGHADGYEQGSDSRD